MVFSRKIICYYTPKFDLTRFHLNDTQTKDFYENLGKVIWLDSNFLQKIWGYLHFRADLSAYHRDLYFYDRGVSFIEQSHFEKVLPLFLKISTQSSLEKQIIENLVSSILLDLDSLQKKEDFVFHFTMKLVKILDYHFFAYDDYKILILEFSRDIKNRIDKGDSKEQINQLLFGFLSKIFQLEKIKNELNLSSNLFSAFIIKNLRLILSNDFSFNDFKAFIERNLKEMNDQYLKDSLNSKKDYFRFLEKLGGNGLCFGLTMSLLVKDEFNPENLFSDSKSLITQAKIFHHLQNEGQIEKKLNLKKIKMLDDSLSITILYEFLTNPTLTKKFSKFNLTINNQLKTDIDGHCIFISLNPIGFFDQNDVNYNDLKFRFRIFGSIEDMLLCLSFLIDKKYKKNNYCDMQLDSYEKQNELVNDKN